MISINFNLKSLTKIFSFTYRYNIILYKIYLLYKNFFLAVFFKNFYLILCIKIIRIVSQRKKWSFTKRLFVFNSENYFNILVFWWFYEKKIYHVFNWNYFVISFCLLKRNRLTFGKYFDNKCFSNINSKKRNGAGAAYLLNSYYTGTKCRTNY